MTTRDLSAMVVGGGRGLGRAIALRLAGSGLAVGVLARTMVEVEATAAEIVEAGGKARGYVADVLDVAGLKRAFARFRDWSGGCDALVYSAGRLQAVGPIAAVDPESWWLDVETSLRGSSNAIREAMPMLKASSSATVSVLVGPGHASDLPFATGYASAQAGLVRMVECLEREMRAEGVAIFAVNPGMVPTRMVNRLLDSAEGRRWLPGFTEAFAEGKEVGSEVVAEMVDWLVRSRPLGLSGRVVSALATPEILETRLARIEEEDLLRLRLR